MTRAISADHILFDECLGIFYRPYETSDDVDQDNLASAVLLTPFEINIELDIGVCTIMPSIIIPLSGPYFSYISRIECPNWVEKQDAHLFATALSTILSFITQQPFKAPRDNYLCNRATWSNDHLVRLAIMHPILTGVPGAQQTNFSKETLVRWGDEVLNVIELLYMIPYKLYTTTLQSMRLAHLSLINKKEDFGLAYLLVVASIEAIAQEAVNRDKVKMKDELDKVFKKKTEEDEILQQLYKAYKEARGNNSYLKERYTKFIFEYAPIKNWENYVVHPNKEMAEYIKEVSPEHPTDYLTRKPWFDKYPDELETVKIEKIIEDSYTHRSFFVHRGRQPPHNSPSSINRFFQENYSADTGIGLLPNCELLLGIAKHSIINWLESKK